MRSFGTRGRLYPDKHYVVSRTEEITDFINRIKEGRYIILFAPRQTGKTTFFQFAVNVLTKDETYFPVQLNFEEYEDYSDSDFYVSLHKELSKEIKRVFKQRGETIPVTIEQFLTDTRITDHVSTREFFEQFTTYLDLHYNTSQNVILKFT